MDQGEGIASRQNKNHDERRVSSESDSDERDNDGPLELLVETPPARERGDEDQGRDGVLIPMIPLTDDVVAPDVPIIPMLPLADATIGSTTSSTDNGGAIIHTTYSTAGEEEESDKEEEDSAESKLLKARIQKENDKMAAMSAQNETERKVQEKLAQQQQQQQPPLSRTTTGQNPLSPTAKNQLLRRTRSMQHRDLQRRQVSPQRPRPTSPIRQRQNSPQRSPLQRRTMPPRNLSNSSSRRTVGSMLEEEDDEQQCQDTLMMIAKARAALGQDYDDEYEEGVEDEDEEQQQDNKDDKQKRVPRRWRHQQQNNTEELQRPGAYSKAPGEDFQRNRTFERATYAPAPQPTTPTAHSKTMTELQQQYAKKASSSGLDSSSEDEGLKDFIMAESDEDKKPAAKPRRKDHVDKRMVLPSGSFHSQTSVDSLATPPPSRRGKMKRVESLSTDDDGIALSDSSPKVGARKNRRMRRVAPALKADSALTDDEDDDDQASQFSSSANDFRRRQRNRSSKSQSSIRLSMLARSFRGINSNDSGGRWSGSGTWTLSSGDVSSDKMIADITEQSVSNFVKSFGNQMSSMDALPIAATVVPSEEDLETLIRSRLETELRTHLSRELTQFRERLFQEIMERGELQVAEQLQMVVDPATTTADHDMMRESIASVNNNGGSNHDTSPFLVMPTAETTIVDPLRGDSPGLVADSADDLSFEPVDDRYEDEHSVTMDDENDETIGSLHGSIHPDSSNQLLSLVESTTSSRRRRPADNFARSIRQSLRIEFGNLGDELGDLEQSAAMEAQVIDIESANPTPTVTTGLSSSQAGSFLLSSGRGGSCSRHDSKGNVVDVVGDAKRKASLACPPNHEHGRTFVFSPRGLLGSVFLVFLLGAFAGAGTSILAMGSIGGEN